MNRIQLYLLKRRSNAMIRRKNMKPREFLELSPTYAVALAVFMVFWLAYNCSR